MNTTTPVVTDNYREFVCNSTLTYQKRSFDSITVAKLRGINSIEYLCAFYYIAMLLIGFRNVYYIFYKQKKLLQLIFPLMYLCG
jgi:hypothetical protein